MRIRFLLGPAGSGKSFRCLTEIRHALSVSPEGPPLVLLAPKQTTYQLERQFLDHESIPGYTRLFIVSFERLAHSVFQNLGRPSPNLLDEEGRVMVLRGLLARTRSRLKLFRASSRLTGFAQQLSLILHELQREQVSPATLREVAARLSDQGSLASKLEDLAMLLEEYTAWLQRHQLEDGDCLLSAATALLENRMTSRAMTGTPGLGSSQNARMLASSSRKKKSVSSDQMHFAFEAKSGNAAGNGGADASMPSPQIGGLWIDGFAELSKQEIEFLAALAPHCDQTTITFCLDRLPAGPMRWLSPWSAVRRSFEELRKRLEGLPGIESSIALLERRAGAASRFGGNDLLQHLEKHWEEPAPYLGAQPARKAIRVVTCENSENETVFAAREIVRHVRGGGRFRDIAVLTRKLEHHQELLQRVFARYDIPYFLDRRESVAHHPLAELTRSALRTVAFSWQHEDWFAALKSGLLGPSDALIDELENEALARGWKGKAWEVSLKIREEPRSVKDSERLRDLEQRLEELRNRIMPPFQSLSAAIARTQSQPTGVELAGAIREFWHELGIEQKLQDWSLAEGEGAGLSGPVHATVWEQMNAWLENVELAFPQEALPLREWLPILEAGLSQLTVGMIPPALDQVLIGALDRSRNPDIRIAFLLGMNETIFPAAPETSALLTAKDRDSLARHKLAPTSTTQYQLGRERHFAYIACTRARDQLILTHALNDAEGSPLNSSPFLAQIRRLFPSLETESFTRPIRWQQSEHLNEIVVPLLQLQASRGSLKDAMDLAEFPAFQFVAKDVQEFRNPPSRESLAPRIAEQLYGPVFNTSVSRLEQFAECPFKFFVHSGLRGEERRTFDLDYKERGTFQHDAMAIFHQQLENEHLRWRDLSPAGARERMGQVTHSLMVTYREGLLQTSEETRFTGRILTESLQNFVEVLVGWMQQQYLFDPAKVELPFGQDDGSCPWVLTLASGQRLALYGRIDRVDLWTDPATGQRWGIVLDYKSSQKQLDSVLVAHGVQLQLLAYLNVLRNWPDPVAFPEAKGLIPGGVFYVNLKGKFGRSQTRTEALRNPEEERKRAYRHTGRFDLRAIPGLDPRPGTQERDQFNFRLRQDGSIHKGSREVMSPDDFSGLLESVEQNLKRMGGEIFSGVAAVSPFKKGTMKACDRCSCQPICRIDPWEHPFRILRKVEEK